MAAVIVVLSRRDLPVGRVARAVRSTARPPFHGELMVRVPASRYHNGRAEHARNIQMRHSLSFQIAAASLLTLAITLGTAFAAPTDSPAPPTTSAPKDSGGKKTKSKKQKQSEQQFYEGYRQAHALIQAGRYAEGIAAMHALEQDDHPDVANYIGYSSRKLGDYEAAKVWYEKALAADPKHARTWQYYGMWHVEQGNMLKAQDHLQQIKLICGEDCKEFRDLKGGMEGTVVY
jgi:tetratricopeptide (TPR) repeat protein